jgi:tRNA modification GTPase
LRALRTRLIDLLADLEAGLDFVEEDIHFISRDQTAAGLTAAADAIRGVLKQMSARATRSTIPRVVLVGPPNAGKSSLFNALLASERAIVSEVPGTTRDYLIARLNFGGVECELVDTAGVESPGADTISASAQQLRSEQSTRADLRVVCREVTDSNSADQHRDAAADWSSGDLLVCTKCDQESSNFRQGTLLTSSLTGAGLAELKAAIADRLVQRGTDELSVVQATAERCEEGLRSALHAIEAAQELNSDFAGEELVAAEIRNSLDELGRVVGAVYTDDLLDRVFSRFCIGK